VVAPASGLALQKIAPMLTPLYEALLPNTSFAHLFGAYFLRFFLTQCMLVNKFYKKFDE